MSFDLHPFMIRYSGNICSLFLLLMAFGSLPSVSFGSFGSHFFLFILFCCFILFFFFLMVRLVRFSLFLKGRKLEILSEDKNQSIAGIVKRECFGSEKGKNYKWGGGQLLSKPNNQMIFSLDSDWWLNESKNTKPSLSIHTHGKASPVSGRSWFR